MKLLRLGSVLMTVGVGLLIQPVFANVKAKDIFEIIPSGEPGNCDGKDLDTLVQEATALNDKAIAALDSLLSKDLHPWGGPQSRIFSAVSSIWGVQRVPGITWNKAGFRYDSDHRKTLQEAKENYEKQNKKLKDTSNSDGGKLSCGPNDWKSAKTFEDIGWDDEYVKKRYPQGKQFPQEGRFYSERWSKRDQGRLLLEESILLSGLKAPCREGQLAVVAHGSTLVTLCDPLFKFPTMENLMGVQDLWPAGVEIDDIKSPGIYFHHEMMHFIDSNIVDLSIKDFKTNGFTKAYGWANLVKLAQSSDQSALQNAESYTIFALLMQFDRIDWNSEGKKP